MKTFLPKLLVALLATTLLSLVETPAASAGSITGKVVYDGSVPRQRAIRMSADPKCEEIYGGERVFDQSRLIGDGGVLANAFVYVKSVPESAVSAAPESAAKLTQNRCLYTPRVQGVRVGQNIDIVNDDPMLHNVRALAKKNRPFNLGQPNKGTRTKFFRTAEKPVRFKCDVHPWMSAFIFVMEHQFHAVTGADGSFSIPDLPDGSYTLIAWHESFGEQELNIDVKGATEASFTLTAPSE